MVSKCWQYLNHSLEDLQISVIDPSLSSASIGNLSLFWNEIFSSAALTYWFYFQLTAFLSSKSFLSLMRDNGLYVERGPRSELRTRRNNNVGRRGGEESQIAWIKMSGCNPLPPPTMCVVSTTFSGFSKSTFWDLQGYCSTMSKLSMCKWAGKWVFGTKFACIKTYVLYTYD